MMKRFRKLISALLLLHLLLIKHAAIAQEVHIVHCLEGCPEGATETNDLVVSHLFALSSNNVTKFADWVAYLVTSQTIGTSDSLNRTWKADPYLEDDETLEPNDYKSASANLDVDRGHQAPLASFAGTVFWRETNYLSNITPQRKPLNQGSWKNLEAVVRDYAYAAGQAYILTGQLYDGNNSMVLPKADESHLVPTAYWKVVASRNGNLTAFIFDQGLERKADYCDQIVTLREVELRSGLDLFPRRTDFPKGNLNSHLSC